jgi:methylenetetrahydrofolate reductase (NADPH)
MSRAGLRELAPLLVTSRYEVLPTASTEQTVLEFVPPEVTVTVTASPVKGLEPTLALACSLAGHGYKAVPHLSARLVSDRAHLTDVVARLTEAGISDVFIPAGDADPPAGAYDSALALLEELNELGRPFAEMGVTGYPESHPIIDDDVTVQAMWDKRRHATYLVSNLCFDPAVLRGWIRRIRARGVTLPLYVGLAGPIDRARLLKMATKIGVAESSRFLAGHTGWFARMGTPGAYDPDRLLTRIAPQLVAPGAAVAGFHVFTFNQVKLTEQWRQAHVGRLAGHAAGDGRGLAGRGARAAS